MDNAVIKVIGIGTAGNEVLNKIAHRKISGVEIARIDTNQENLNKEVEVVLHNSDLVFILMEMSEKKNSEINAIVAQTAKAKGILTMTVAVTSVNSNGETEEIEKLKEISDTVIVLSLKKLAEADPSATFDKIFEKRDESFIKNVEFIANVINKQGVVNLDLDDVKKMLKDSKTAVTVFGKGEGQDRIKLILEQLSNYPFSKNLSKKARKIMINIVGGADIGLQEIQEIVQKTFQKFGSDKTGVLWGYNMNPEVEEEIEVGILMTDFSD